MVAALVNFTVLLVIAAYLLMQGVIRLFDPQPVVGWLVVVVATVALVVDLVTVLLTRTMAQTSVNIRAAMLHNLADAMTSLGVIIAGVVIVWFDFYQADVIVTFLVAGYVLYHVGHELRSVISILMNSAPAGLHRQEICDLLNQIEGVDSLHHVHLWSLDEDDCSFDAHVLLSADSVAQMQPVRVAIKQTLAQEFGIHHSTLEFEFAADECSGEACSGEVSSGAA